MINYDLKEIKKHGTDDYNFDVYKGIIGNVFKISVHWHDEYEIIHVFEGELELLINGKKHTIRENEAIFINSQAVHSQIIENSNIKDGNRAKYLCYVFGEKFVFPDQNSFIYKNIYSKIKEENVILTQVINTDSQFGRDFISLLNSLSFLYLDRKNAIKIQNVLLKIFDLIIDNKSYSTSENNFFENNTIIIKALELIHEQHLQDCSVSNMSKSLHLNVDYFIKLFKKHVGITPNKYILELKLDKATQMLKYSNDISVSAVAEECGFKDLNYFCRLFKKYNKQTPSELKLSENQNIK